MTTKTNLLSHNSSSDSSRSSWRWGAIVVSLIMALLASIFIMLLSNAVDREVAQLNTSSELREQADLVLIGLIDMAVADRSYAKTRKTEDKVRFENAAREIDDILDYTALIVYAHPQWYEWFTAFKKEVEARKAFMNAHMHAVDVLPDQSSQPSVSLEVPKIQVARLAQLMTSFLNGDDAVRQKQREGIALMRAALTLAAILSVVSTFISAYFVINRFHRDVRSLKMYQLLLHSENRALEARVKERTQELEKARNHAEKERQRVEMLLQDASHRIGNSLGTVSSLLGLQLNRSKNEEVRSVLGAARDRIQTISTAHRRLRLSDDMETTLLAEFLSSVVHDVELAVPFELRENITVHTNFKDCRLSSRDATTLGIILGELLTNSFKHAFPDQRAGHIYVSFGPQQEGQLMLIVEDDGVGMKSQRAAQKAGLGRLVVEQLCMQFGEKPLFETSALGGTKIVIPLPKLSMNDSKEIPPSS
ncbi:sensor histidine kinase [Bartonella vinsonii]|uniref:histidine kinase n=1 Tax=Bartonella vinsonii subsp. berkhoffii str. Tweed TaxID=1094502 RepID=N6VTA7_BARVB|nr:sensor histidine kinase [Bartonella vinsonii]AGF76337.1 sensor histidine kinase [Bartonella vinsonii subsp. berkhoffii str. Winnie]ENN94307.1 sensor histidine kinase [Bartonella vinsonii subsp. berkhoffii str. Tweed]